jgi:opacity protein-like surface antigen
MRKLILAVTAVLALSALTATAAQACSYTGAEQVFSPWGDQHSYVLAPNGGFEAGGLGWALTGGAGTTDENESFFLNDASDSRSLSLPAGSSAVSPPVCMSIDTPIFRLVARNTGDPSAGLRVEAVYPLLGLLRTKTVSTVYGGSEWAPSQQMSTVLTLSTILGTVIPSSVQIRITPVGSGGNWQVDDLYIDPFARR